MKRARKLAPKKTKNLTPKQLTAIKGGLSRPRCILPDEDGFIFDPNG